MRILFTGASSFTGWWFVRTLEQRGHTVVATFRKGDSGDYQGIRGRRVAQLEASVDCRYGQVFGEPTFVELARSGPWDVFCHHAADVSDYRSPSFDPVKALGRNCHNIREVLRALKRAGCGAIVLTGSVFEGGEGAGSEGLTHVSPYGLSKALTWEYFRCESFFEGLALGKFVIPNPFGPWEEDRFTLYLASSWLQGKTPSVRTPLYVRDNIHVDLLALEYATFVESMGLRSEGVYKLSPSGYIESQEAFTRRFARELSSRLGWPCQVEFQAQKEFAQPLVRINTEASSIRQPEWNEELAWDRLSEYYRTFCEL